MFAICRRQVSLATQLRNSKDNTYVTTKQNNLCSIGCFNMQRMGETPRILADLPEHNPNSRTLPEHCSKLFALGTDRVQKRTVKSISASLTVRAPFLQTGTLLHIANGNNICKSSQWRLSHQPPHAQRITVGQSSLATLIEDCLGVKISNLNFHETPRMQGIDVGLNRQ